MRILFLVQSCNQERYIAEEEIIRNTWAKRLRNNCEICFYRGDGDNSISKGVLSLKCGDDLDSTFAKTLMALSVFKKTGDYDFIVRTNTSNWINVDLLCDLLETLDPNKRELYGGDCIQNTSSHGIPFLRGNLLIFNRTTLEDLFEAFKIVKYNGCDDVCIGLTMMAYYTNIGVDYFKTLKLIENLKYTEKFDYKKLNKTYFVRCIPYIIENEDSTILAKLEEKYRNNRIIAPTDINVVETELGKLKLG